ncbi:BlaI/MecI/CopY family transcriptional regulator [Streptomyces buecherae]|uniref:BlaI/MecI/CopY family transcriptional regulator n=1 Tax=Streptomyces buecherae TaxID=2763006 RepID=UPI00369144BC
MGDDKDEDAARPSPQRGRRRGQGELEALVMRVLQGAGEPVTAARVQQELGGDLAYTTVVTILTRLHGKHSVTRHRAGRSFRWAPAADEAGLAAQRMRRVLDGHSDRDAVLASFVSGLSADDERLVRELLHDAPAEADATAQAQAEPGDDPAPLDREREP